METKQKGVTYLVTYKGMISNRQRMKRYTFNDERHADNWFRKWGTKMAVDRFEKQ